MEVWKVSYCDSKYEVSSQGRVRFIGLPSVVIRKDSKGKSHIRNRKALNVLKPYKNRDGYLLVTISKKRRGVVHRMVCWAFHGPPPFPKAEVNHLDGNKLNNNDWNLEWSTRSKNIKHSFDKLNHPRLQGSKNPFSDLTEELVLKIREELIQGIRGAELARKYRVAPTTISSIKLRKSWKHI